MLTRITIRITTTTIRSMARLCITTSGRRKLTASTWTWDIATKTNRKSTGTGGTSMGTSTDLVNPELVAKPLSREADPSTHHPQTEERLGPRSLRMTARVNPNT